MNYLKRIIGIFDSTIGVLAAVAALIIVFMTGIVCWDVLARWIFGSGPHWVLEIVEYGLLWFTLLAAAWILKEERHVKIDILILYLRPRSRNYVTLITSILAAVTCLIVAWYGTGVVLDLIRTGEHLPTEMKPPKFLPFTIIPISFFLLFLQFLRSSYKSIRDLKSVQK